MIFRKMEFFAFLAALGLSVYLGYRCFYVSSGNNQPHLGLDTLLQQVKHDLVKVDSTGSANNEAKLFKLKNLDLELNFIVSEEHDKQTGLSYNVLTVSSDNKYSTEQVQKIMLHYDIMPTDSIATNDRDHELHK